MVLYGLLRDALTPCQCWLIFSCSLCPDCVLYLISDTHLACPDPILDSAFAAAYQFLTLALSVTLIWLIILELTVQSLLTFVSYMAMLLPLIQLHAIIDWLHWPHPVSAPVTPVCSSYKLTGSANRLYLLTLQCNWSPTLTPLVLPQIIDYSVVHKQQEDYSVYLYKPKGEHKIPANYSYIQWKSAVFAVSIEALSNICPLLKCDWSVSWLA